MFPAALTLGWMILGCAGSNAGFAELDGLGVLGLSEGGSLYLCGDSDHSSRSRWLVDQGDGSWTSEDTLWTLDLSGSDYVLSDADQDWQGTLTPFARGGVFEGAPEDCRSGAVLAGDALSGTWCDGLGAFSQVEPVDPVRGEPEQLQVQRVDDPEYRFSLQRLP